MPIVIQSDKACSSHLGSASSFGLEIPNYIVGVTFQAAYSLRQVRQTYSGPVVKVRNKTSNAEADVAFSNYAIRLASTVTVTEAGTSGYSVGQQMTLQAFASANDVAVVVWYDQSGNGRNLLQRVASATSQPSLMVAGAFNTENGMPIVVCDGSDDGMVATWGRTTSHSIVAAGVLPTGSPGGWIDGFGTGGTGTAFSMWANGGAARHINNGSAVGDTINDVGQRRVYAGKFAGASSAMYVDGVSVATGDAGARTATDLRLGYIYSGSCYNGKYWEVLVCSDTTPDLVDLSRKSMAYHGTY